MKEGGRNEEGMRKEGGRKEEVLYQKGNHKQKGKSDKRGRKHTHCNHCDRYRIDRGDTCMVRSPASLTSMRFPHKRASCGLRPSAALPSPA